MSVSRIALAAALALLAGRVGAQGIAFDSSATTGGAIRPGFMSTCDAASKGAIRSSGTTIEVCSGTGWNAVTTGNVSDADTLDGLDSTAFARLSGAAFTGNITGAPLISTSAGGTVSATNVYAKRVSGSTGTFGSIGTGAVAASGNITAANISATGNVSVTGNVSAAKLIGDGSLISNIPSSVPAGTICGHRFVACSGGSGVSYDDNSTNIPCNGSTLTATCWNWVLTTTNGCPSGYTGGYFRSSVDAFAWLIFCAKT
jgi:hypothetical protein